mmetsp:Transcript_25006/g.38823  ORF Transcript_25006/g.38823 Transcript_25006/m.38823 type:complete len:94 (+) Transcript_25006:744-1025(+)
MMDDQKARKSTLAREDAFNDSSKEFKSRAKVDKSNKDRRAIFLKNGHGITREYNEKSLNKLEFQIKEPKHVELGKTLKVHTKMQENSMLNLFK